MSPSNRPRNPADDCAAFEYPRALSAAPPSRQSHCRASRCLTRFNDADSRASVGLIVQRRFRSARQQIRDARRRQCCACTNRIHGLRHLAHNIVIDGRPPQTPCIVGSPTAAGDGNRAPSAAITGRRVNAGSLVKRFSYWDVIPMGRTQNISVRDRIRK